MEKYNLSRTNILSRLAIIEKHLDVFSRNFYEVSQDFTPRDVMSIHGEASKMMRFVGLNNMRPYIAFTKTDENVGGNVDLDKSDDVFIEISEKYKYDKEKVLAVMAHEICHKVLYVHNLYYPFNNIENELMTDLATVYVGFGKLSLNGCYKKKEDSYNKWENGEKIKVTTTKEEHVGYLSLKQFALAYDIVCSIYGIDVEERMRGLTLYAKRELEAIPLYTHNVITPNDIQEKLKYTQEAGGVIIRDIILINNVLEQLKSNVKQRHHQYKEDFITSFKDNPDIIDKQIVAANLYATYGEESALQKIAKLMEDFLYSLNRLQEIDTNVLLNVECPCCGYKKQRALQENKKIFIKCPKCGYMFVWNGEGISRDKLDYKKDLSSASIGFMDKIKSLFKKNRSRK